MNKKTWTGLALVVAGGVLAAVLLDRRPDAAEPPGSPPTASPLKTVLGARGELLLSGGGEPSGPVDDVVRGALGDVPAGAGALTVEDPRDGSVFPPAFVPPTFLWRDPSDADVWLVTVTFADEAEDLEVLVAGQPPPAGEIDPDAVGATNEVYVPPDAAALRSWTPSGALWEEVQRRTVERPARITLRGLGEGRSPLVRAVGHLTIATSRDPVGAPIFYRDVPLMPAEGTKGVIKPLAQGAIPLIAWRLKDVTRPESKVVLTGMPSCANCHSFSRDGRTLAMDVDGPQGDKGAYALAPIAREMAIDTEHVISWNSFPEKPAGHKTIGFLSRVSPDGKHVLSTVNEALYVANFTDYRFLQVFYPTRGILAWYSTETGEMKALPGADDPAYVHCSPVWTPDGQAIVFSRAEAFDPYEAGRPLATEPNDPNEPRILYDLYRMPFNDGKGGVPEPIEGASRNGMSNTFPKVSPDGKWIVYTKCRNGQLMRPDGKLWIVPAEGGEGREMRCNTELMNSWHSFSPNGRWMVFSSKSRSPYTQMFLTHIDEDGNDSPAVLVPRATAANRAVNLPEFANIAYGDLDRIEVPAVNHHRYLWDALQLVKKEAYAEAIPLLERALEVDEDFSRALVTLGLARIETGRPAEALPPLERALAIDPASDLAHHNLGLAHSRLEAWDEAERHYREALDLNPRRALTWNNLGYVRARRDRLEEAIGLYQKAIELDPDLVMAWTNLADALRRQGRKADALSCYREAARRDPSSAQAQRGLAGLLLAEEAVLEAVPHLRRAVELDPGDWHSRMQLAWVLATSWLNRVRDGTEAVRLAREACDLTGFAEPGPIDVLAAAYAEAGRFEEAVQALKRAVQVSERQEGTARLEPGWEDRLRAYETRRPHRERPRGP